MIKGPKLVPLSQKMQAALKSWSNCNAFLKECAEDEAFTLLHHEQKGKQRMQYMLRMHSRFNTLRAQRERLSLTSGEKL